MRWIVAVSAVLLSVLASVAPGVAQQYPNRTVTIIVPYPAGGPTDQLAREIAPALSEKLGQNFIVENVSGGGTNIATARVVRAEKDGHTLLLHNLQISANVSLYNNLPFDTEKDLSPVIFINNNPLILIGRKTLEPNTLKELIALMKTKPLKAAHPGSRCDRAPCNVAVGARGKGYDRPHSVPRRGAGLAGYRRRPCRSVLRHAAVGGAAGCGRRDEGLRYYRQREVTAVSQGR